MGALMTSCEVINISVTIKLYLMLYPTTKVITSFFPSKVDLRAGYGCVLRLGRGEVRSFPPDVEPYSVDEAFMKAEGILSHFTSSGSLGMKIKDRIMREAGLTCSIGFAPNKLLAKLATGLKKPDGLTVLEASDIPAILEKTSVKELCGIGPRAVEELSSLGGEFSVRYGDSKEDLKGQKIISPAWRPKLCNSSRFQVPGSR